MRCLSCGEQGIALDAEICPKCEVHLPSILRGCLPPGTPLLHGTYQIDYPLGRGGFGITYRALDRNLNRSVAIKEFFPQDYAVREQTTGCLRPNTQKQGVYERGLERFIREGCLLASLDHPGIVRVYNAFQERETAYLAMELIDGITLRDELNRQPQRKLTPKRTIEVITKLVEALDRVHQQDIYHLDLSPDNVMLTAEGRTVLIDFGASRQGLGGQTTQAYKEAYAPPEVLNGQGMGAESDVFELGMMLWELLTGERPPSAISRLTSVIADGRDTWRPIGLDEPWAGLVSGAIRLKQQERPQKVLSWWPYSKERSIAAPSEVSTSPEDRSPITVDTYPATATPMLKTVQTDRSIADIGERRGSEIPLLKTVYTDPDRAAGDVRADRQRRPAGLWLRLGADAIDRTLLIIGSAIVNLIFQLALGISVDPIVIFIYYIMLGFAYAPILDSSDKQGTLGKQIMGIMVTDLSGRKVNFQRALTRHACKIFSYLTLLGGFIMVEKTSTRQTLHDRLAKCLVVKR